LRASLALVHQGGKDARLYIVRTHLGQIESARWNNAFAAAGVRPRFDPVGAEPLLVVDPRRP